MKSLSLVRPDRSFNPARSRLRRCILSALECREVVPSPHAVHLCYPSPRSLRVWRLPPDCLTILHLALISVLSCIIPQESVKIFNPDLLFFILISPITRNKKHKKSKGKHETREEDGRKEGKHTRVLLIKELLHQFYTLKSVFTCLGEYF